MQKNGGLRRHWLAGAVGVVCILGLVFALGITAVFAGFCYKNLTDTVYDRCADTAQVLSEYQNLEFTQYYDHCLTYVENFAGRSEAELQFLDGNGALVVSSQLQPERRVPVTEEVYRAIETLGICTYRGDAGKNGRVVAASSPVIYKNGELVGIIRYVADTGPSDRQIILVAVLTVLALVLICGAVLVTGHRYIRSILEPVTEITEKAQRIAAGSYGIQIQTPYDDEIGELARTINDLSMKISQNELTQREFISSLSHELRTPLTAITGWSETILADESLDAATSRGMKIISREANRLTEMVVDLLDFTKIQDGKLSLNMELTDLRSEFEDTVFMYGSRLAQDGICLEYLDSDASFPEILCDPKRLRQVFLNILDNAAKHGGDGKRIEAAIRQEDDSIVIQIRDFGPGIEEDELPLVKKKFYKGSSKARGSGIGLAVCDEIVQLHGGTLELSNAPGGGTLVTIGIPVAQ